MSPLGTAASLGGGLFLGLAFFISSALFCVEPTSAPQWPVILVGGFAGFVGSLVPRLCSSISARPMACFMLWRRAGAHQPTTTSWTRCSARRCSTRGSALDSKRWSPSPDPQSSISPAPTSSPTARYFHHHFFVVDLTPHRTHAHTRRSTSCRRC